MARAVSIVGARPQFIKASAMVRAFQRLNRVRGDLHFTHAIVHTGQHYDAGLSDIFFKDLSLPEPHVNLGVGSCPHGEQTGRMLMGLEPVLLEMKPDIVLLYGDTNSTLAGTLAASKLGILSAHVEAGLRSRDRSMPEEQNRIVADALCDLLFCSSRVGVENLRIEGRTCDVFDVGDIMCDVYLRNIAEAFLSTSVSKFHLRSGHYYLATVHRAANMDCERLRRIFGAFAGLKHQVFLPMHPRTSEAVGRFGIKTDNVILHPPVSYLDMLALEAGCRLILTDSGGIQKEAYWAGKPCVVLSERTEWVELVEGMCSRLAGVDRIMEEVDRFELLGLTVTCRSNIYGDGNSADLISDILTEKLRGVRFRRDEHL